MGPKFLFIRLRDILKYSDVSLAIIHDIRYYSINSLIIVNLNEEKRDEMNVQIYFRRRSTEKL